MWGSGCPISARLGACTGLATAALAAVEPMAAASGYTVPIPPATTTAGGGAGTIPVIALAVGGRSDRPRLDRQSSRAPTARARRQVLFDLATAWQPRLLVSTMPPSLKWAIWLPPGPVPGIQHQ